MSTDRTKAVRDAAAFCALLHDSPLDPPSEVRQRDSELQQLSERALDACTRMDVNVNRGDVLMTALELLDQPSVSSDDVLIVLLRLVAALQSQVSWSASVNTHANTVLTALVRELEQSARKSAAAVAAIAREIITQLPVSVSREPHTHLSSPPPPTTAPRDGMMDPLPLGNAYLELCIEHLRNGTSSQQVLTLDQLRALPNSLAEQLVREHNGAALLAPLVWQDADQGVYHAAYLLVQHIAQQSAACRETMLQWWLTRQEQLEDDEADGRDVRPALTLRQAFDEEDDAFVNALSDGCSQFPGAKILASLRFCADRLAITLLWNLAMQPATVAYLSKYHSLVQVLVQALRRLQRMTQVSDATASTARAANLSAQLWTLLVHIAQSWTPRDRVRPRVVAETHDVAKLALEVLATESNAAEWASALTALLTVLNSADASQREAIASFVDIARLVRLLAAQTHESALGCKLITVLRTISAVPHLTFAREIEQVVASLAVSDDALSAPHVHNLLLITRDVPGVQLGVSSGIDHAISVRAVVDVLVTTTSETERVVALRCLYRELALDEKDPLCYVDANPVTRTIAERLSSVIAVAFDGSADVQRLSRPIVTAVARSDAASLALVAKYVTVAPTLVLPELRELALAQSERTTMRDDASDAEYDYSDDEYDYSDDDEDEDEDGSRKCGDVENEDKHSDRPQAAHDDSDWEIVDAM